VKIRGGGKKIGRCKNKMVAVKWQLIEERVDVRKGELGIYWGKKGKGGGEKDRSTGKKGDREPNQLTGGVQRGSKSRGL